MVEKAWKRAERAIARILAGKRPKFTCPYCGMESDRYKRVPVTGRTKGTTPDIEHDWLSVEVKSGKNIAGHAFIKRAMSQATAAANYGELPVVILHKKNTPHAEDFVVITAYNFVEWFGEIL